MSHSLQVPIIHTARIPTDMIWLKPLRNRSAFAFIGVSMRQHSTPVDPKHSVPVLVQRPRPYDAISGVAGMPVKPHVRISLGTSQIKARLTEPLQRNLLSSPRVSFDSTPTNPARRFAVRMNDKVGPIFQVPIFAKDTHFRLVDNLISSNITSPSGSCPNSTSFVIKATFNSNSDRSTLSIRGSLAGIAPRAFLSVGSSRLQL